MRGFAFILILTVVLPYGCYSFGWQKSHKTIETECQRLGSFYVGSKTFKCIEIEGKQ